MNISKNEKIKQANSNELISFAILVLVLMSEFSAFPSTQRFIFLIIAITLFTISQVKQLSKNFSMPVCNIATNGKILILLTVAVLTGHTILNFDEIKYLFYFILKLFFAILYICWMIKSEEKFLRILYLTATFCVVYGLLSWPLQFLLPLEIIENDKYSGRAIAGIFFFMAGYGFDGLSIGYRNQGFFSEPGLYAIPAVYLYCTLLKQNRLISSMGIISIIGLLTSASLAGLIAISVFHVLSIKFKLMRRFLIILISISFIYFILEVLFKINYLQGQVGLSTLGRAFDLIKFIEAFVKSPIVGYGLNPSEYNLFSGVTSMQLISDISVEYFSSERGQTNSFLKIILAFGFPVGLYHLYLYKNIFPRKGFSEIAVAIIIFASQPVALSLFALIVLFSGLIRFERSR
jgi:hypothetical protein